MKGNKYSMSVVFLFIFGFFCMGNSPLYAEQEPIQIPEERAQSSSRYDWYSIIEEPLPDFRRSSWEVVPEVYLFFYEEPSLSVEWEGVLYGIRSSFTKHMESNPLMARLEGRYSTGDVDYDGSLQNGTPHTDSGTDYTFELRGLLGYDWTIGESVVTSYLGFGYRYWFDDLESPNAYERNIRYFYSPLGIEYTALLTERWIWGIRMEYDLFWRGRVRSHLSDVNPLFDNVDNIQDSGFGARGSIYFHRMSNEYISISIEPFIRYWNIKDSDTVPVTATGVLIGTGKEPANWTIESGLQISLVF